jgi:translocation and assembly module TamB
MRRLKKIALWTAAILLGVPLLLVALLLLVANTDFGRGLMERQLASLTSGQVVVSGLGGRFPDALRLRQLALRDAKGVWLTLDDVRLDWSPTALIHLLAHIDAAYVGHATIARLPVPSAPAAKAPPSQGGFSLPVRIQLDRFDIARADLGAALAGVPAALQLQANAAIASLHTGRVALQATRLDGPGHYQMSGSLNAQNAQAQLSIREAPGGLISQFANLPALGAIVVDASLMGPMRAEQLQATAQAGASHLNIAGTADLIDRSARLDLTASAPAMRPGGGVAWQGIDISAHVAGPFTAPVAQAHIGLTSLTAGGAAIKSVMADVSASEGTAALRATLDGLQVPGVPQAMFTAAPIIVTGGVALQAKGRPAHFTVAHPLLAVEGDAVTAGDLAATVTAHVPDIAPFAAIGKIDLRGSLVSTAHVVRYGDVSDMRVAGKADFTGGQAPVPNLLGATNFAASASLNGQDFTIHNVTVDGRALHADIAGTDLDRALDLNWHLSLPDLSAVAPQALGALKASGHLGGHENGLSAQAAIDGDAGTKGFAKAPVTVHMTAENLPAAPSGEIQARASFAGGVANLEAGVNTGPDGTIHAVLRRGQWKTLSAGADLSLPKGGTIPLGRLQLSVARLDDFAPFASVPLAGALRTTLTSTPDDARIVLDGKGLTSGGRQIQHLQLTARAAGPVADPDITGLLTLDGIEAPGITGQARITAQGRAAALAITGTANLDHVQGAPAQLAWNALLDAKSKSVLLRSMRAGWKTLVLHQNGPARIDFGTQTAIDKLSLSLNAAQLRLSGRISPTLDLRASLQNLTPDLVHPFLPELAATGVASADAQLIGTLAAPVGRVRVTADGVRLRTGPGAAIPPASLHASANLDGRSATLAVHLSAGPKLAMSVNGNAGLSPGDALALHGTGNLDVTLLNPILEAEGRNAAGKLAFNVAVGGRTTAPRVTGTATLVQGEVQDYVQGLHLTKIAARIDADGDTLHVTQFTAAAGTGTLGAAGTVGLSATGHPVDLHITARHATPLASDLLTAQFDADLAVAGAADGNMTARGSVLLRRVDINIPDNLPAGVAVLHVRRPGDRPPPRNPVELAGPVVALNINVDAPSNIFVRGKGLDAELGGKLTIAGTSVQPLVNGGFDLRRGDFSLAGTSLDFSKGTVSFNGVGVTGKIDPTLDFEADSTQGGITATLKITGYADAPKIALSSVPDLPQDEVLAHLLFGESLKQLSPLQIAEIGAALAELSGVTGSGGPLGSIRKGLGLDRLSVGGGTNGAGASVQAGRYVAKGVYVGAKQAAGGAGGTQAQVQVDLTRHLKLQTTLGTGGGTAQGATPQDDPGSSIGLSYQFNY